MSNKSEKITHDQYLEEEKARMDVQADERAQAIKSVMKEFRDTVREIIWEHTAVGNAPKGEWCPEYFIPWGEEAAVDNEIDEAVIKLLKAKVI